MAERPKMNDVLAVILGGGRGTRLFPLTLHRSKPAVPIGGKYRLIDIPVSNCLNSSLRRIYVLTQYNSESLNKHLGLTYKFDIFSRGFVSVLAAEQTSSFGILKVNRQGRIVHFEEKPPADRLPDLASEVPGLGQTWLASMGIYLFSRAALDRAMADAALVDFGRHVIPEAVPRIRVQAHVHRGYWEDVGTIRSYYLANL